MHGWYTSTLCVSVLARRRGRARVFRGGDRGALGANPKKVLVHRSGEERGSDHGDRGRGQRCACARVIVMVSVDIVLVGAVVVLVVVVTCEAVLLS